MARSWRDYASAQPCDKSDNSDTRGKAEPFVPSVPFVTALPATVRDGLVRLSLAPAPRLLHPERWPNIVSDAQRLASDGWALAAMKLGWTELDLFGAVPDKDGDPAGDGLAVKLCGRPVLAICASFATVRDGPGARTYIYRGNNAGSILLWDLGRTATRPENRATSGKGNSHGR